MSGSVLIADASRARARRIREACSSRGFATSYVPNGSAALESALADVPDVIVAPQDLELIHGTKLAEILRANPRSQDVRFVLLGRLPPGAPESAFVDEVLAPGSEADDVALRVEMLIAQRARVDAASRHTEGEHEVEGRLSQIPLTDLLQLFHMNHRTGTVALSHREAGDQGERGTIWLSEGNVIQAAVGGVEGEKALYRMLAWKDGSFAFAPNPVALAPRILTPTRALLMEGMRQIDEWDRMRSSLPPLDSEVLLKVKSGELPHVVHPLTQEVLVLLELHGTVREVVDHCSHPDYQVLRTLQTLLERELIQLRHPSTVARRDRGEGLFSAAQARRLRDWLQGGRPRSETARDAKLLLVAADAATVNDFVRLLSQLPGLQVDEPFRGGSGAAEDLATVGRLSVDVEHGIELVHVPTDPVFEALWPVATHGCLGSLVLIASPLEEAEARLRPFLEVARRQPHPRLFHALLLRKGERLAPEEMQSKMALLDESSLFLLPLEGSQNPQALLRTMLGRILP